MLSVADLWSLVDREAQPLAPVRVPLGESLGRRLAEDIPADVDMPAFSRSAIDGYAVAEGSAPGWFHILGEVRPGMPCFTSPKAGEAVKIFTGSALPDSGIGLVMVEDTIVEAERLLTHAAASQRHIRGKGRRLMPAIFSFPAGVIINPGAVALLASVGVTKPLASSQVRAAHLVTGSELVPADSEPRSGFIRDSNSPLIAGLLAEAGAKRTFHRHVSESVDEAIAALENVDVDLLLISGGASVGAYDGTGQILKGLGFVIHSSKVSSRPGKPLIFATRDACAAFGLPGNPLSHFVCFHLFVRRAIDAMAGRSPQRTILVRLAGEAPRSDPRETWWPAAVRTHEAQLVAEAIPWKDSSDVTGLARANALLRIANETTSDLLEALLIGSLQE